MQSLGAAAGQDGDCLRALLDIASIADVRTRCSPTRASWRRSPLSAPGWRDAPRLGPRPRRAAVDRVVLRPGSPNAMHRRRCRRREHHKEERRHARRRERRGHRRTRSRREGPPVLLLHGFPDSGRLWRHQVPALVAAGFRTVVPDLRGYGASDKPTEVEAYSIPYAGRRRHGHPRQPGHRAGPRRGPRLGRGAGLGPRVARSPTVSTAWWRCRSATPCPSCPPASPSARSPGTCSCSSSRASPRSGCRTTTGKPARVGPPPRHRRRHRRAREERLAHPGAQLVPGQRPAPSPSSTRPWRCRRWRPPPWGCGARRLRPHRAADDAGPRPTCRARGATSGIEGPGHWMQLEAPDAVNELLVDFLSA